MGSIYKVFYIFFFLTIILSSCATLPAQELNLYSSAFEKTRIAGDLMFDEIVDSGALRTTSGKDDPCAINPSAGYRPCFDPAFALGEDAQRTSEPIDIRIRRAALRSISTYNILLSELSEGKSANALSERIDQFSHIVVTASSFVPSINIAAQPALAAFQSLATRLETLRSSNAAAQALISAEDDIRSLILFLIEDTSALYKVYTVPVKGNRGRLKIALKRAEIRQNSSEVTRLKALITDLSNPKSGTNKAAEFEVVLTTYVRLLNETDQALQYLVARTSQKQKLTSTSIDGFIRQSTEIRLLADMFLSEVRNLQSTPQ